MFTDVQIVNQGLSKVTSSRISTLTPPKTSLEQFIAANYKAWKQQELSKKRWVFALVEKQPLVVSEVLTDVERPYKYALPDKCLRAVRSKYDTWVQRGRYIYSYDSELKLTYIKDVDESEFDPLFVDVLACRIAFGSAKYVTASAGEKKDAEDEYKEAVAVAGRCNAYTIGAEDIQSDDGQFSWVNERF